MPIELIPTIRQKTGIGKPIWIHPGLFGQTLYTDSVLMQSFFHM